MSGLHSRTVNALWWNLSGISGKLGLQLGIQVCLARLLLPSEFGIMAMLMTATSIGQVFIQGGFGIALVQKKNSTIEDESTVLFLNIGIAALVSLIFWLFAPLIAQFYGHSELKFLLRFSLFGLWAGAFSVVQNSLLTRELQFKKISLANVGSSAISGGIAVWMAYRGYGVWSLATQFVLNAIIGTLLLWLMSTWRPAWTFRLSSAKQLAAYGSRLLFSNLLSTAFQSINAILIGKFYTSADLGYYNRAQSLQGIPGNTLSQAVGGVMLPALVQVQDRPDAFRKAFRDSIRCTMALALPMMALMALLAAPLITFLLSEKWLPAVPFFQLFCISGALYPLHLLNINVLLALGRPELYLRTEFVKRIIALCGAFIALPFGVMALAAAAVFISFLCLFINTYYTKKLIGEGIFTQTQASWSTLASTGIALLAGFLILNFLALSSIFKLIFVSLGFGVIYFLCLVILNREIIGLFLKMIKK